MTEYDELIHQANQGNDISILKCLINGEDYFEVIFAALSAEFVLLSGAMLASRASLSISMGI